MTPAKRILLAIFVIAALAGTASLWVMQDHLPRTPTEQYFHPAPGVYYPPGDPRILATLATVPPYTGPTAQCRDGSLSYSSHHSGTCSYHTGVAHWLDTAPGLFAYPPTPRFAFLGDFVLKHSVDVWVMATFVWFVLIGLAYGGARHVLKQGKTGTESQEDTTAG